jgi:modulator of FtsH protease HflK
LAKKDGKKDAATEAGRGATGRIVNYLVLLASIVVLGAWAWQGVYNLKPGEAAVILRFGAFDRIQLTEGLAFHLPPPLESHHVVNTGQERSESFGARQTRSTEGTPADAEEAEISRKIERDAIQTADNNIVNVSYELQYKVGDAYAFRFSMADPAAILHDATEAAMRSVVGKRTIDAVLSQDRSAIQSEAQEVLEGLLLSYVQEVGHESAFKVGRIKSAGQDEKRSSLQATGDAREIMQVAQSEAAELREQAAAFKRSKIIEAKGEATRFEALLVEYRLAPEVTCQRLYLETMEEILPGVEKMVVEPNTVNMLPVLPLGGQASPVGGAR